MSVLAALQNFFKILIILAKRPTLPLPHPQTIFSHGTISIIFTNKPTHPFVKVEKPIASSTFHTSYIELTNQRLHLRRSIHTQPTAPTFVLIHGVGMSGRYFERLATHLAPAGGILIVDLLGFGRSAKPQSALTLSQLADTVYRLLLQTRLLAPVLIGHSMGCEVVVELLRRHPQAARAGVLIAPTVNQAERTFGRQFLRLAQDGLREPPTLNVLLAWAYLQCGVPRYLQTLQFMLQNHIETGIAAVPVPLLILRGQRDPIVPHGWARALADRAPQARLQEITGAPHAVHFQSATAVAAAILNFLTTPSRHDH
jgi:pimeloyl-ACP methyl ester carboxylesterase